jgi:hypothetical protein
LRDEKKSTIIGQYYCLFQVYAGRSYCGTIYYKSGQGTYVVPCQGKRASYVKIVQPSNYLSLAEVEVFGGPKGVDGLGLLSYRMPTGQSSVGHGGRGERAVDGNTNGYWGGG